MTGARLTSGAAAALVLAALLACARGALPPHSEGAPPRSAADAGLVEPAALDPGFVLDLRYATDANFLGRALYPAARCWLRPEAAERLARAQRRLAARGLRLVLWDCYRPLSVQRAMWAQVPDARYVADPREGSKHNRGMAVDVTLADAAGRPLEMPTDFDDFSERAGRAAPGASAAAHEHLRILEDALVAEGFEPLATEWWHYDAPGWRTAPLLDLPLGPDDPSGRRPRGATPARPASVPSTGERSTDPDIH